MDIDHFGNLLSFMDNSKLPTFSVDNFVKKQSE